MAQVFQVLDRDPAGAVWTIDVPAGDGFRAEANHGYRIVVDGKAALPPGTVVTRVGKDLKIRLANGEEITISGWSDVAGATLDTHGAKLVADGGAISEPGFMASGAAAESAAQAAAPATAGADATTTASAGQGATSPTPNATATAGTAGAGSAAKGTAPAAPPAAPPEAIPLPPAPPAVIAPAAGGGGSAGILAGVGILAGLGAAAGGGGGGGGSSSSTSTPPTPATSTAPSELALAASSDSGTQGDRITNDSTPTITGRADANATITVRNSAGATVATATADASGNWSATPTTALPDGSATLQVTANRGGGASDSTSASITLTIDTSVPAAPTAQLDATSDSGTRGDNRTNDTTPTISGTGTAGDTIKVTFANGTSLTTTVAANGTWSITPTTALANGANAVTVTASDTAGNVSSATTLNLTIESVGPSAPVARLDAASDSGTAGDNITSDTTPTISGTGTAGHTISVSFAGGLTLTTTVAANGTWSVTPATALAGGAQAVSVTATDASGNVSSPTVINLTIDTVAPAAPTAQLAAASDSGTPGDNRTNDSTPTISGTGTAGDRITVTFPTGAALTATVAADGSWSVTPTTAQANGANAILVTATDPAGNVSAATTLNLTIDTTAPAAPTAQLAAASDSGTLGDNRTNDSTPTISGTGTAGDTITVTFPTGPALTTTVAANGSWSVTPATAQAAGAVPVTVTATDAAGNVSTATTLNLTIDTAAVGAPTAQLAASSDSGTLGDNTTSDTTPTISGTGTAGETITVTFPVGAPLTTTVAANGTWSVTPTTAQSAGAVAVQVTATNAAGTVSPATTLNLTIDNVAPAAPVAQLAAASDSGTLGDNRTNDTTPTISGSGTPGDTITVTFPAGGAITTTVAANGSWSATPVTVQTSGAKNISVTATDPAGNVSAATTLTVTIDTTAPSAPTAQLATASDSGTLGDNRTNDTTPTISGTGTAGDTITVNFPTGAPVTTTVAANGSWSVAPASALASGANAISATATDAAGNVSPATTLTVTIDTTPPVAPTLTIPEGPVITSAENANGIQATVTGTFASGETITVNVTRPDATTTSVTHVVTSGEALAGSASVTIPAQSVQGAYSVHATVSDVAGNVSANSPVVAITLDSLALSAPTIAMTEAADGFINDAEAVSGAGSPVVVTLPTGAAANDVVHVTLSRSGGGSTTIDHTVTAGEALAGSLTVTIPTASFTPDGSYSVTATITDSGGNTSAASSAVSFTLDRALPAAVSAPNLTTASDSGSSSTDNITSDTTPTFSGTGAANGATVTLYDTDGTTVLGTGTANGAGSWSVTTTALAAGNHTITARQADAAGNSSAASPSLTVTIDATGPSFGSSVSVNEGFASTSLSPVTLAATDNTTAQASLTVTGASFVSGSGFVAGDVTIGVAGGVATVTRAAGAVDKNGSIVVAVTMTDLAGNATTQNVTINVASVNDAPSGVNATLLTTQNTALVFGTGSFALTDAKDSPANTLASVIIDTLPVAGQLTLNGIAVTIGQEVSAAEIAAGHLVYTPGLNGTGTGYASFTFQVRDNGGTANGGVDLDATPNTITIDVAAALTLGGFGANGGLIGTATTDASGGLLAAGGDGTGVLTLSLDGGALVASVSGGGASGADGAVGAGSALPPLVPVTSLVDPLAAAPGVSGSSLADLH